MPYIDSKITKKLTDEKKETIKAELGKAITALNKPESFLMVGIADGYDLWFAGNKLESGAYIEVSLLGDAASDLYDKMTGIICDIMEKELDIPKNNVYVTYHPISNGGWNGRNF